MRDAVAMVVNDSSVKKSIFAGPPVSTRTVFDRCAPSMTPRM